MDAAESAEPKPAVAPPRKPRRARGQPRGVALTDNVVTLHARILPRHQALLTRWVDAGRRMGLCDASAFRPSGDAGPGEYVLVWVRENIDPAYMILPEGRMWVVVDAVRQQHLARVTSFDAALHAIRPVLPADLAA